MRDLLAKHTPVKLPAPGDISRQQNETTPPANLSQLPPSPEEQLELTTAGAECPPVPTKKLPEAKEVAQATRNRLRQMGIEVETPSRPPL